MEDIQKLKRKRKMKGDQLGRALLGIIANGAEQIKDPSIPEYLDAGTLARLVGKIDDAEELERYNFYEDLYLAINSNKKRQAESYNDARGCLNCAFGTLHLVAVHNNGYAVSRSTPLILTSEERDKILNKYRYDRNAVCDEIIAHPDKENGPAEIRKVLEYAETIPSDKTYTTMYWTLPDGRSSEDYSDEEWQEILEDLFLQDKIHDGETKDDALDRINDERFTIMSRHAFLQDLRADSIPQHKIKTALEIDMERWGRYFLTSPVHSDADAFVREAAGIPALPLESHTKTHPLETEEGAILAGSYPQYYIDAVSNFVNGIAPGKDYLTWSDLVAAGVENIGMLDVEPFEEYAKTIPGGADRLQRGIAVSDKGGVWQPEELKALHIPGAPAAEVYRGMKFVYGYNAMIDIYAEVYEVPELAAAKMDTSKIEQFADTYNKFLCRLYGSSPEQEVRDAIHSKMEYVKLDQAKPDPDKVKDLVKWFQENKYTRAASKDIHYVDVSLDRIKRF